MGINYDFLSHACNRNGILYNNSMCVVDIIGFWLTVCVLIIILIYLLFICFVKFVIKI
uniref:p6 n=1 Tax=Lettuce chlorosis virus TaxID=642478 RepID=A0A386QX88_9CLOS|nr:p6 [Lettuce chlorosis virus]